MRATRHCTECFAVSIHGAFSVSQSNVEKVRAYIGQQEEHHRTVSFQDEFRPLCRNHGVKVDEHYVLD